MTDLVEPPNHSVVGWGAPIRGARVRLDEFVDEGDDPLERWYDISDGSLDRPVSWTNLLDMGNLLYLLERVELE